MSLVSDLNLLFTLSLTHSLTHTITQSLSFACACCYDMIYGAQDGKMMCSHANSLILSHQRSMLRYCGDIGIVMHSRVLFHLKWWWWCTSSRHVLVCWMAGSNNRQFPHMCRLNGGRTFMLLGKQSPGTSTRWSDLLYCSQALISTLYIDSKLWQDPARLPTETHIANLEMSGVYALPFVFKTLW